jgi:hypothetical protein
MGVTGRPREREPGFSRASCCCVDEESLLEQNVGTQQSTLAHKRLTPLMIAHQAEVGNAPSLDSLLASLVASVRQAAADGTSAHETERRLFCDVLALGREAFALFLSLQGQGDLGEQITLPDGRHARRLPQTHDRAYRGVFGDFTLPRVCYGSREKQKIDFVPLDARLQLPQSDYSYLLQQWDQTLGCECAFARVAATIQQMLGVEQPVDSLERQNRQTAEAVAPFRQERPLPQPEAEGEVFVVTDDAKGVVMRRDDGEAPVAFRKRGDKANKKRMAVVGAIYSVGRFVRTPQEMAAALFRDPHRPGEKAARRPEPVGKHVWARLSEAIDAAQAAPITEVFGWQKRELDARNPGGRKEVVCVMDGQPNFWEAKAEHFGASVVEVLDLLHVTPRLWQAAHLFCKQDSEQARQFVRARVLRVLSGEIKGVLKGLRRLGTTRGLKGKKKSDLRKVCNFLSRNADRMRYDEYLKKGYPIASGVIEGACRHYVKDRMERSGMRWSVEGAQAMLDVRSEYLNGDWDAFHAFRIDQETRRLYPHRQVLETIPWSLAS